MNAYRKRLLTRRSRNPITQWRFEQGWTQREAAFALRISTSTLEAAELGNTLTLGRTIRRALARKGYPAERLAADYRKWRRVVETRFDEERAVRRAERAISSRSKR